MVIFHSYVSLPEGNFPEGFFRGPARCRELCFPQQISVSNCSSQCQLEFTSTSSTAQGGGGSFKNRKPIG